MYTLRRLFITKVTELLLSFGADQHDSTFILQTQAGKLTLQVVQNLSDGLGMLHGCFDDPQTARYFVYCDPATGRWDFHFLEGWTVDRAIRDLSFELKKVLK